MRFLRNASRRPNRVLDRMEPSPEAGRIAAGLEQERLHAWWAGTAQVDQGVVPPDARTRHKLG
jgi:hypothetical protein